MSIFPTRVKPGGSVTFHLSVAPPEPLWAHLKAFVVDPLGKRTLIFDKVRPFFPAPPQNDSDRLVEKKAGEFYQTNPLLMAAVYLQEDTKNLGFFAQNLRRIRDSTHNYISYRLPKNAPLGRYRMEIEYSLDGETSSSSTGATDYFLVESLSLLKVAKRGRLQEAHIKNPSREPVLAQLVECISEGRKPVRYKSRLLNLKANSVTPVPFKAVTFLCYLAGQETLQLGSKNDPVCIRNPAAVPVPAAAGALCVFLTHQKNDSGFLMDKAALAIWEAADGFRLRSRIRNKKNARVYASLVKSGLIIEFK